MSGAQDIITGTAPHLCGRDLPEQGDALAQAVLLHHAPQHWRLGPVAACTERICGHMLRNGLCGAGGRGAMGSMLPRNPCTITCPRAVQTPVSPEHSSVGIQMLMLYKDLRGMHMMRVASPCGHMDWHAILV